MDSPGIHHPASKNPFNYRAVWRFVLQSGERILLRLRHMKRVVYPTTNSFSTANRTAGIFRGIFQF